MRRATPVVLLHLLLLVLPAAARAEKPFYVNVGDSYAVGYQPGRATGGKGGATTDGYAERVAAIAAEYGYPVRLRNFGCVGASSRSLLERPGCPTEIQAARHAVHYKETQAAAAVRFLRKHRGKTRVVTVSIGRNDIRHCLRAADVSCVRAASSGLSANLTTLLGQLRDAAGPKTRIIGLTYPNVDLAAWGRGGKRNHNHARRAQVAYRDVLNPTLRRGYEATGGEFVDVTEATGGYAPLPGPVQFICAWTWYCRFHDVHANPAGYAVIGQLVAARLAQQP